MEKDAIISLLIGGLVLAILGLLIAVSIMAYLLLRKSRPGHSPIASTSLGTKSEQQSNNPTAGSFISDQASNSYLPQTEGMCSNHPEIMAQGTCSICGDLFCETCLKTYEMLHFCHEHYQLFLNNKWVEVETIKTSPNDPESGLALYSHKEKMWREFKIPSYIMTHYKIDIENDLIESHIKLYAKDSDRVALQRPLNLKREHQQ